jgi:hypothetical protein
VRGQIRRVNRVSAEYIRRFGVICNRREITYPKQAVFPFIDIGIVKYPKLAVPTGGSGAYL